MNIWLWLIAAAVVIAPLIWLKLRLKAYQDIGRTQLEFEANTAGMVELFAKGKITILRARFKPGSSNKLLFQKAEWRLPDGSEQGHDADEDGDIFHEELLQKLLPAFYSRSGEMMQVAARALGKGYRYDFDPGSLTATLCRVDA